MQRALGRSQMCIRDRKYTSSIVVPPKADVALRKESVDRNNAMNLTERNNDKVALRKESVDRNC